MLVEIAFGDGSVLLCFAAEHRGESWRIYFGKRFSAEIILMDKTRENCSAMKPIVPIPATPNYAQKAANPIPNAGH